MTPTNELRFVERKTTEPDVWQGQPVVKTRTIRILQQKWGVQTWMHESMVIVKEEWRDVPIEKEDV